MKTAADDLIPSSLRAWKAANPLRRWLDRKPIGALGNLAKALGMTRASIHWWMNGGAPRYAALVNLQQITGIAPATWMRWLADRPNPTEETTCEPKSKTAPSRPRSRVKSSTSTPRKRRPSSGSGSTPGATTTPRSLAGTMS